MFYVDGEEFGPLDDVHVVGDSLTFRIGNNPCYAARNRDQLSLRLVVPHGRTHLLSLTFVSSDTTRSPSSLKGKPTGAAAAPTIPLAPDSIFLSHAVPPSKVS